MRIGRAFLEFITWPKQLVQRNKKNLIMQPIVTTILCICLVYTYRIYLNVWTSICHLLHYDPHFYPRPGHLLPPLCKMNVFCIHCYLSLVILWLANCHKLIPCAWRAPSMTKYCTGQWGMADMNVLSDDTGQMMLSLLGSRFMSGLHFPVGFWRKIWKALNA